MPSCNHILITYIPRSALILTLPVPIPNEERKLTEIFIFALLYGASKIFKIFWGTTIMCKNKKLIFILIQLSRMHRMGRVNLKLKKMPSLLSKTWKNASYLW